MNSNYSDDILDISNINQVIRENEIINNYQTQSQQQNFEDRESLSRSNYLLHQKCQFVKRITDLNTAGLKCMSHSNQLSKAQLLLTEAESETQNFKRFWY